MTTAAATLQSRIDAAVRVLDDYFDGAPDETGGPVPAYMGVIGEAMGILSGNDPRRLETICVDTSVRVPRSTLAALLEGFTAGTWVPTLWPSLAPQHFAARDTLFALLHSDTPQPGETPHDRPA